MVRNSFSLWFLLLFTLSSWVAGAEEARFWSESEAPEGKNWRVFVPSSEKLKEQGTLVISTVSSPYQPSQASQLMGTLFSEIKNFKMMGQKQVPWERGTATLVSFQGDRGKSTLIGRALVLPSASETQVVLLVRHPKSSRKIVEEFNQLDQSSLNKLLR